MNICKISWIFCIIHQHPLLPYSLAFLKIKAGLNPIKDKTKFPFQRVALHHFYFASVKGADAAQEKGRYFIPRNLAMGNTPFPVLKISKKLKFCPLSIKKMLPKHCPNSICIFFFHNGSFLQNPVSTSTFEFFCFLTEMLTGGRREGRGNAFPFPTK